MWVHLTGFLGNQNSLVFAYKFGPIYSVFFNGKGIRFPWKRLNRLGPKRRAMKNYTILTPKRLKKSVIKEFADG